MNGILLTGVLLAVGLAGCHVGPSHDFCGDAIDWHRSVALREHLYGNESLAKWHDEKADAFYDARNSLDGGNDLCKDWLAYRFYPGASSGIEEADQ